MGLTLLSGSTILHPLLIPIRLRLLYLRLLNIFRPVLTMRHLLSNAI